MGTTKVAPSALPVQAKPTKSSVEVAKWVLQRLVGPFAEIDSRASGAWVDVEVELSLANHRQAERLAWGLVVAFSKEVAPRYLGRARVRIVSLGQDPFFAAFCERMRVFLEQAEQAKTAANWKAAIQLSRDVYEAAEREAHSPAARAHFAEKAKQRRKAR